MLGKKVIQSQLAQLAQQWNCAMCGYLIMQRAIEKVVASILLGEPDMLCLSS